MALKADSLAIAAAYAGCLADTTIKSFVTPVGNVDLKRALCASVSDSIWWMGRV